MTYRKEVWSLLSLLCDFNIIQPILSLTLNQKGNYIWAFRPKASLSN
jgi:hypothetical protein